MDIGSIAVYVVLIAIVGLAVYGTVRRVTVHRAAESVSLLRKR